MRSCLAYSRLPEVFFERLAPASVPDASLLILNDDHARHLGFEPDELRSPEGLRLLSGQVRGSLAMAYAGHQFGHWAGLLGDGRARLVAEAEDSTGRTHEVHLKGAGATRYSRGGDGKATLGAAIREYVVSEGMAALGVPTTRGLAVVSTGEAVLRRSGPEPGAIIARTAESHVRVGTFELAAAVDGGEHLRALADFAIDRLDPDAPAAGAERYVFFLRRVGERQARLVARWMALGFIHGVMNTDNMALSGETIDYGPCAFMDTFDAAKVFSSIDRLGRYAWQQQSSIAAWNLARLAETLFPLLADDDEARERVARESVDRFLQLFPESFHAAMAAKLGLRPEAPKTPELVRGCLSALTDAGADFTVFFRTLTRHAEGEPRSVVTEALGNAKPVEDWLDAWRDAFRADPESLDTMGRVNPVRIPRNHRVEQAIAAANAGDPEPTRQLLAALAEPFTPQAEYERFEQPPAPDEIVHETFCGT